MEKPEIFIGKIGIGIQMPERTPGKPVGGVRLFQDDEAFKNDVLAIPNIESFSGVNVCGVYGLTFDIDDLDQIPVIITELKKIINRQLLSID